MHDIDASGLPFDPDADTPPRPLHLRVRPLGGVFCGGFLGTAARDLLQRAFPTPDGGFPWATFAINVVGGLLLGVLLKALVLAGSDHGWRRRTRLFVGTGFCGAVTTYSSLAADTDSLLRGSNFSAAVAYSIGTVVTGLVFTWVGIVLAGRVGAASMNRAQ